jgi:hypothetical protein
MVLTAGLSMVNVGVGYAVGIVLYYTCARGGSASGRRDGRAMFCAASLAY